MDGAEVCFGHEPFTHALLIRDDYYSWRPRRQRAERFKRPGNELELIPRLHVAAHDARVDHAVSVEEKAPGLIDSSSGVLREWASSHSTTLTVETTDYG
nr:hypothetical protein [Microbacterium sp.]